MPSTAYSLPLPLALTLASWTSFAQDFYHGGVSPLTVARAGIYAPQANNAADALTLNPAGLTALNGASADLIMAGGLTRGTFSNITNQNSAMRSRPAVIPLGAVGIKFGSTRWSAGLGFTPDFLSSVNWRYADAPGAGGANYGPQSEKSEIVAYRASGGIGFAASKRVSLGATVGMVYSRNTLITPFIFQSNPSLAGLKTLLVLHTHGLGWGGSVGATLHPTSRLTLNAAYSAPVAIHSHGDASGNMGVQFQVLGIPFQPAFSYKARVGVRMPASVIAGGRYQATRTLGLSLQGDFDHFHTAFKNLPVSLSNGSNSDINGFLHSDSIADTVPLNWSDQYTIRTGIDRTLGEHAVLNGGFIRRSSLVPNGTITPLTGAIMKNSLSTGCGYGQGRLQFSAAYSINLNQTAQVGTSGLLSGEYSHSRITVGTQAFLLGTSFQISRKPRP